MRRAQRHRTRRAFVVAAALACAVPAALAQTQRSRVRRIGLLAAGFDIRYQRPFLEALQQLGWVEGKNIAFEQRWHSGDYSKLEGLVGELLAQGVELIVVPSETEGLVALRKAPNLPVVFWFALDPVGNGYARSLARPGGNATGLTWEQDPRIVERYLQFMKEMVPGLKRFGMIRDTGQSSLQPYLEAQLKAAPTLGITVEVVEVNKPDDLDAALAALVKRNVQAVQVFGSPMIWVERERIATLVRKHRLPDIGIFLEVVELGGLMSYGVDHVDLYRRSAGYIDKILKGAKPGDLPFEQPRKYDLVINLKTAKELGLVVPRSLLVQAERVIE